nr:3-mercaptopyruvate sulfurtransferase [uncultured Prevotella sp.]DAZ14007.1 MAG TPA: hypothetical protein [Caudoviricetes sp.]
MKVRDFERAIDALSADITIDEMKLRHSDVRQVNAHTDNQLIVWDEYGRAFSAGKESGHEMLLAAVEDGNIVGMSGMPVERDKSFDLKFE